MKAILVVLFSLLGITTSFAKPFRCTIKGTVIGRDSKYLILKKATEDERVSNQKVLIRNNKFEYSFNVKDIEAYELIFDDEFLSSAHPIVFFPTAGVVSFKLYALNDAKKDKVVGGKLNKDYADYNEADNKFNTMQDAINYKIELLEKNKEYNSPAYDSVMNIIYSTKDHSKIDKSVWQKRDELRENGGAYTEKGKLIKEEEKKLFLTQLKSRYSYIGQNRNLLSYYFILADAQSSSINNSLVLSAIKNAYPAFADTYPSHPYTAIIKGILYGLNDIKPGKPIIDLSLPDIKGDRYSLASLSKNKITLIDFWGSWCGPCISATRTMLPVYSQFKDKGFAIVGIAKEYKNTNSLKVTLKREQYPWINLVELNDKNGVWNKYGITSSTGMMLLVDKEGKIVAIDPTAAEVKKYLLANL